MAAPPITERHKHHFHRLAPIKELVRCATTATITIATGLNNGDTIDGITLATGDRVLVKNQSTPSQNGIYVVGVTPVRDYDLTAEDPGYGFIVLVLQGTANAGTLWQNTNTATPTIGSTSITFAAMSSGGGMSDPMTTRGDIIVRNASNVTDRLGIGASGKVLSSDGTDISWQTPSSGFSDPMTTRGDIIYRNPSNTTTRLPAGTTPNDVLTTDGTDISWQAPTGGGGGLALSVLGYNTIGGTQLTWVNRVMYATKITLSGTSCILSVGAYIQMASLAGTGGAVAVYADSSGPVGNPLAVNAWANQLGSGSMIGLVHGATNSPSWQEAALGIVLPAGDYWIGFMLLFQETNWKIYYDGSGSDKEITMTDAGYVEGIGRTSVASASRKYSIRANILS